MSHVLDPATSRRNSGQLFITSRGPGLAGFSAQQAQAIRLAVLADCELQHGHIAAAERLSERAALLREARA